MKISVKDIILDTDPRIRTKSEQVPLLSFERRI